LVEIAIPAGYVLFVFVPMALTFWFFMHQGEDDQEQKAQRPEVAVRGTPEVAVRGTPEGEGRKVVVPPSQAPKQSRKVPPATSTPAPTPDIPDSRPPTPEPMKIVELPTPPTPPEMPETPLAPIPREVFWKPPQSGYSSKWQTVGAVNVRVAGAVVAKVPLVDTNNRVNESPEAMLIISIEVVLNTPSKTRLLRSWTQLANYGVVFLDGGKELAAGRLPSGSKLHSGIPVKQPIPQDGTPVRDILLFSIPDAAVELNLRLVGHLPRSWP